MNTNLNTEYNKNNVNTTKINIKKINNIKDLMIHHSSTTCTIVFTTFFVTFLATLRFFTGVIDEVVWGICLSTSFISLSSRAVAILTGRRFLVFFGVACCLSIFECFFSLTIVGCESSSWGTLGRGGFAFLLFFLDSFDTSNRYCNGLIGGLSLSEEALINGKGSILEKLPVSFKNMSIFPSTMLFPVHNQEHVDLVDCVDKGNAKKRTSGKEPVVSREKLSGTMLDTKET